MSVFAANADPSLLPLVVLAHVDEQRAVVHERLRALRPGFFDLGLDRLEQVSVRRHSAFDCMDAMSPRARIFLVVGLAAAAASGIVVIGVLATRSNVPVVKPRTGSPPLALDLGVRTDPENSLCSATSG